MQHVAVIDFGKTNVKVALVDIPSMAEIAVHRIANAVDPSGPYPHYRTGEHWDFITGALAELALTHTIDALSITTHGATAALVDAAGDPVLPILDYEHAFDPGDYDTHRPAFAETGSPRLGMGLNLGAQLYWQFRTFPEAARVAHILTYPQYWAMRLTGIRAAEPTSLGCHTDLWRPATGDFSALVDRMGWRRLMPPVRHAADRLGPVLPEIAAQLGLPPGTPVTCGIHDSNASLYPYLATRPSPFTVVSTGTWVVCMAAGARPAALDPARDVLINVDAFGHPVPSARFMGGREYERIRRGRTLATDAAAIEDVLNRRIMLLPAVESASGPFRGMTARWVGPPADARREAAALSFYLALMTAECLFMIGADGPTIVEGPFASNPEYIDMLHAATGRAVEAAAHGSTGTALGAALLAVSGANIPSPAAPPPMRKTGNHEALCAYARIWRQLIWQEQ
ncbi:MAG: FGGY-family carbohydrate kinase [Pseudochelatococcus sp.]|jgi:sugar (pentulose or hexulose) kinase|uniref:FGGY-family carbohydrate kinase n=1 Tax=Pseudochelatococcus sp. TaxID=2020869 RepID=UPI003D8A2871